MGPNLVEMLYTAFHTAWSKAVEDDRGEEYEYVRFSALPSTSVRAWGAVAEAAIRHFSDNANTNRAIATLQQLTESASESVRLDAAIALLKMEGRLSS